MQILPNGQVQISNKMTGETKAVNPQDLGQYGISQDAYNSLKNPSSSGMTPANAVQTPAAPPAGGMGVNTATAQDVPTTPAQPPTITGHTLAEHSQALNAAKAAGDTGAIKQITDDYNREYAYQKDMVMPQQAATTKTATAKSNDYNLAKGHVQNVLDQFQNLSGLDKTPVVGGISAMNPLSGAHNYGDQVKGMAASLAPLVGGGSGSGLRITKAEIDTWAKLMPQTGQTADNNQNNLISLDKNIRSKFQQGLDPEYLQQFGITRDDKGNYVKGGGVASTPTGTPSTGMQIANAVGNTIKNVGQQAFGTAKNDINDIVAGIVSQHGQKGIDAATKTATQLQDMAAKETDPQKKKVLLSQANSLWTSISNQAGQEGKNFSPDVNQNPLTRAAVGAAQIGTGADVLAHPVATVQGITSPITHPIQTIKNVVNVVKDPVGALTGALKNDWEATQKGWNPFNQPGKAGIDVANATQSTAGKTLGQLQEESQNARGVPLLAQYDEAAKVNNTAKMQQIAEQIKNAPADSPYAPYKSTFANISKTPAAATNSTMDNLSKRINTANLPVPDETNVTNSEKLLNKTLAMTKSNDVRGIAKELEASVPANSQAVVAHAKNLDKTIGMQPLDENLNTVLDRLSNTSAGQANPQLIDKLKTVLQNQMKAGSMGQEGIANGKIDGTNFEKMNDARTYLNSGLTNWFKNGRPEGSPTNDLNALKWEASTAIKDMMGEGDKAGVFKDLLDKQHTALQVAPVFAKSALTGGTPISGLQTLVKKGWDATGGKVLQGAGIAGARAMQEPIAVENAVSRGTSNAGAPNPPIVNNAPSSASNQPLAGAKNIKTPFSAYQRAGNFKNGNPRFSKTR